MKHLTLLAALLMLLADCNPAPNSEKKEVSEPRTVTITSDNEAIATLIEEFNLLSAQVTELSSQRTNAISIIKKQQAEIAALEPGSGKQHTQSAETTEASDNISSIYSSLRDLEYEINREISSIREDCRNNNSELNDLRQRLEGTASSYSSNDNLYNL
ncbi:MAG: hypothetical protein LBG19_12490 [Prevotellaceae bacterium]|jgi:chromosome segregation ATPase|nr:hypothetical protein [Prevotellaceae bacterium]